MKQEFFSRRFKEENIREQYENPQNGEPLPELQEDINVDIFS